jgi:nitrogen fixation/metabolism regulation signal transduction histidine kinase
LFFAKKVAKEYGGKIVLVNSNETGGAKVEISFIHNKKTNKLLR